MDFLNRLQPFLQEEGLDILAHSHIALSGLGGVGWGGLAVSRYLRRSILRLIC